MKKYSLKKFLELRPRSEKEIRDKLIQKNFKDQEIEKIIANLKQNKIINDQKFAVWWVEERITFKPRGNYLIAQELKQKGISQDQIKEILPNSDSELEMAKNLAENKIKQINAKDKYQKKQKLAGYLSRKGFSWDIVSEVLNDIIKT